MKPFLPASRPSTFLLPNLPIPKSTFTANGFVKKKTSKSVRLKGASRQGSPS